MGWPLKQHGRYRHGIGYLSIVLALMLLVIAAGCSLPGSSRPVPAELKTSLLTLQEVGEDFKQDFRGKATFNTADDLCPDGRAAAGDAVDVLSSDSTSALVSYVSPKGYDGDTPGDVLIQHFVVTADAGRISAGMAALKAGFDRCYGTTWKVKGQSVTVDPRDAPNVGAERFGVVSGDNRTVYVRQANVFMIVAVEEKPNPAAPPRMSEAEFVRIVEAAARHLPS